MGKKEFLRVLESMPLEHWGYQIGQNKKEICISLWIKQKNGKRLLRALKKPEPKQKKLRLLQSDQDVKDFCNGKFEKKAKPSEIIYGRDYDTAVFHTKSGKVVKFKLRKGSKKKEASK